jgi:hypothetical protein
MVDPICPGAAAAADGGCILGALRAGSPPRASTEIDPSRCDGADERLTEEELETLRLARASLDVDQEARLGLLLPIGSAGSLRVSYSNALYDIEEEAVQAEGSSVSFNVLFNARDVAAAGEEEGEDAPAAAPAAACVRVRVWSITS